MLVAGDPQGHANPFGAKAAGQARAGKVANTSMIVQPANERQRVEVGDYVLANDRIALYVEDRDLSSGYARFGGELLAVDAVGDDGRPRGVSQYGETLMALSNEMIDPDSVSVVADGSDGKAAIVRVLGRLKPIPFLAGSLGVLFPRKYGLPAACDFVLEPGSEKLQIRLQLVNETEEQLDFGLDEMFGFFHYNRSDLVTSEYGYAEPAGKVPWAGFDGGDWSFAWRTPGGELSYALTQSGFSLFAGAGFTAKPCTKVERVHAEIIAGGPGLDGLREAIRRADGETPWRSIAGTVKDGSGAAVPGAFVHVLGKDGRYLSRAKADAAGSYQVHAPAEEVTLVPVLQGYPKHGGTAVASVVSAADLAFAAHGVLHVKAVAAQGGGAIPVRIQVTPATPVDAAPAEFGMHEEKGGKLYQEFAVTGEATLPVPPGAYRVLVSHGFAWEMSDTTATVAAGEVKELPVQLVQSVALGTYLCTDLHAHTWYSADSQDPVDYKVAGAVADGLTIPVASDHEWVTDPQLSVQRLGLQNQARGLTSSELTTFTWGHFGVIPMTSHPDEPNGGAVDWIGKDPKDVFDLVDALPEKPLLIVNHPRGGGFGAYFDAAGYKPATGKGNALYSDNFDAIEVANGSSFEANRKDAIADWFSFLDRGSNIWAVGSSDNHHLQSGPLGYPRTCLHFAVPEPLTLTPSSIRDALASGAAIVSGGIFLHVQGPSGELPGQTVSSAGSTVTLTVRVDAPSWVPVDTLEVIVDGKTVEARTLANSGQGPGKHFVEQVEVTVDGTKPRTWVVFHATGAGDLSPLFPGRSPFAFSNPVFLKNN